MQAEVEEKKMGRSSRTRLLPAASDQRPFSEDPRRSNNIPILPASKNYTSQFTEMESDVSEGFGEWKRQTGIFETAKHKGKISPIK
ncbi:hypothetical protein JTE90_005803 [Oedothorax gibbosus]|uniref:Uncharacterized protein n=1 Tax=Oedothorax gibbosus TaxID=931172 RepID=A0AAV6UBR7_9ARAC|nr:hypothetical protein JTE90_005803 [Oedothorax gibbosus]